MSRFDSTKLKSWFGYDERDYVWGIHACWWNHQARFSKGIFANGEVNRIFRLAPPARSISDAKTAGTELWARVWYRATEKQFVITLCWQLWEALSSAPSQRMLIGLRILPKLSDRPDYSQRGRGGPMIRVSFYGSDSGTLHKSIALRCDCPFGENAASFRLKLQPNQSAANEFFDKCWDETWRAPRSTTRSTEIKKRIRSAGACPRKQSGGRPRNGTKTAATLKRD